MAKLYTIDDCSLLDLPQLGDRMGHITPINNNNEIPFEIKRIFYIYDIPGGASRGAHAHKTCHQFITAVSGAFEIQLDDGENKKKVLLNRSYYGIHIPPGIWALEMNFSSGSICLALVSHLFDEDDYIRNYDSFLNWRLTNQ